VCSSDLYFKILPRKRGPGFRGQEPGLGGLEEEMVSMRMGSATRDDGLFPRLLRHFSDG
jgi:hypothetical protein